MATKGQMGAPPDWLDVVDATGGQLPVAPWELIDRPFFWLAVTRAYQGARHDAANARNP